MRLENAHTLRADPASRGGRARRNVELTSAQAARCGESSPASTSGAPLCCTASPVAARPRCTAGRGGGARARGARPSSWCRDSPHAQTAGRFVERFGDPSRSCTHACPRASATTRVAHAQARSAAVRRSALGRVRSFDDLGLIVIDEEQRRVLQAGGGPALRRPLVAERRAALEGALLVTGSATPRPEAS